MRRLVLLAMFLTTGRALADAPHPAAPPQYPSRSFVLANGLDVYLEHDPSVPLVAVSVSYAAGSRDDPRRLPGLAHLTEHVTYQGTRDLREDEVIATLERLGAQDWNGETHDDETTYYASAPRESVATLLWVEAQRMAFVLSHANETTVAHQRQVVSREWQEHVGDHAGSAAASILASALYPAGHPYARAAATPAETSRLTLANVQWFYQTHYRPSRARLAVVGDVPLEESERLVRSLFAGIVDRGPPLVRTESSPIRSDVDRAIVLRAPTTELTLSIAWPTPAYFEPLDAEFDVVSSLLCSNESSDLSAYLVRFRRVALEVDCVQASRALASMFVIGVKLSPNADPGDVVAAVEDVLAHLDADPPDEPTVDAARDDILDYVITNAHDGLYRAQMATGWNVSTRASVDRYSPLADVARYRAVTGETVSSAIHLLASTGRTVVLTIPDPEAPDEGEVVERREVRR